MTPLDLQDELVEEIKRIFNASEYLYKKPTDPSEDEDEIEDVEEKERGFELVPIQVFAQDIPVLDTDDESDPVPYIIVRLNSGSDEGTRDSFNEVKLVIIIGIWDDNPDQQGYRDVMNIIQKLYHRFHKDPNLNGKAAYSGGFKWAMQEDGYFPYFFGACTLTFNIAAIRREDRFA